MNTRKERLLGAPLVPWWGGGRARETAMQSAHRRRLARPPLSSASIRRKAPI